MSAIPRRARQPRPGAGAAARRRVLGFPGLLLIGLLGACGGGVEGAGADASPDAQIRVHPVNSATPTDEGLAYLAKIAAAHEAADAARAPSRRLELLRAAMELTPPAGVAEAELARLELAARLGEVSLAEGEAGAVIDELAELLAPSRSLPLDRASAHALTVLGDLARAEGDDALAAGSYARAVRVLSMIAASLDEEMRP